MDDDGDEGVIGILSPDGVWETMTFGPDPFDCLQDRYTSKLDALAGHSAVVRLVAFYFDGAPRRMKKALRKWRTFDVQLRPGDVRRIRRALHVTRGYDT